MKKVMSVAALSLALVFGFGMVAANTASAIGSPDAVKLLHEIAAEQAEMSAIFTSEAGEASNQYRVLEIEESESYFEELVEGVGGN